MREMILFLFVFTFAETSVKSNKKSLATKIPLLVRLISRFSWSVPAYCFFRCVSFFWILLVNSEDVFDSIAAFPEEKVWI